MDQLEDDRSELARDAYVLGFRVIEGSELLECIACSALCRQSGMDVHDRWHDRLDRDIWAER